MFLSKLKNRLNQIRKQHPSAGPRRRIHLMHGVVEQRDSSLFSHRNYISEGAFAAFLDRQLSALGPWNREAQHDVLTVDDGTVAGKRACEIAAKRGHHVILFMNPHQTIMGELYFFSIMEAALDQRTVARVVFDGQPFDLSKPAGVRAARVHIRTRLMKAPAPEALEGAYRYADQLGVRRVAVPQHATVLSMNDLRELVRLGVQIENHGWDHQDIGSLNAIELERDITKAGSWLRSELGVEARLYAVPYGISPLPPSVANDVAPEYFLANDDLPQGEVGANCWNRRDLVWELVN